MKIAIMSDSSCGLKLVKFGSGVHIIPTTIHFEEDSYVDGVDITTDEFYTKLEGTTIIPKTSAPLFGDIISEVEKLKLEGYTDVIMYTISFGLSKYGESLQQRVKDVVSDINFYSVDSQAATLVQGIIVYYAYQLAQTNQYNVQEIINLTNKFRKKFKAYFIVDKLSYLIKNGRLSVVSGTMGMLLQIKPVLELTTDGYIIPIEKIRTFPKALEKAIGFVHRDSKDGEHVIALVLHTNRLEEAQVFYNEFKEFYGSKGQILLSTITSTVGAHVGSKVLGMGSVVLDDLEYSLLKDLDI